MIRIKEDLAATCWSSAACDRVVKVVLNPIQSGGEIWQISCFPVAPMCVDMGSLKPYYLWQCLREANLAWSGNVCAQNDQKRLQRGQAGQRRTNVWWSSRFFKDFGCMVVEVVMLACYWKLLRPIMEIYNKSIDSKTN